MDTERLAKVYSYVLQATGDPGKAAQAMQMAAQRAGQTPGIMSRVQNDPFGSFGREAEARNPDPANLSFSQFNDPSVNPNAPIMEFGRQALGMVTPYELGGGAAQMATGDVMGGAARTAMAFPFFPKIRFGKAKTGNPLADKPDSYFIDLASGRAKPMDPALDADAKAIWSDMQAQARKRWEVENPSLTNDAKMKAQIDNLAAENQSLKRSMDYTTSAHDRTWQRYNRLRNQTSPAEPTAGQPGASGPGYSDPVIDPDFFGGSAPASRNSPPAYQDPIIDPADVDNLPGGVTTPRDSKPSTNPRPGADSGSASLKLSKAERLKVLEYATSKWNRAAGRGIPDVTYEEVAQFVPGRDPKVVNGLLDKIKAKMRRAGSKRRFRAQVDAGDIVPMVGVTVGAGAAGTSFFPNE